MSNLRRWMNIVETKSLPNPEVIASVAASTAMRLFKEHNGQATTYILLPETAKNTIAHSLRKSYRTVLPDHPFGLVIIPTEALISAIGEHWVDQVIQYTQRGESKNGVIPDHGSSVWPILLSPYGGDDDGPDLIEDGWHRLCSYIVSDMASVPALIDFYPSEDE